MRVKGSSPNNVIPENISFSRSCPYKISEICEKIFDEIFVAGVGGCCGAMIGFVVDRVTKNPENINTSPLAGMGINALAGLIFTIALHHLIIKKCEEKTFRRLNEGNLSFPAEDGIL